MFLFLKGIFILLQIYSRDKNVQGSKQVQTGLARCYLLLLSASS